MHQIPTPRQRLQMQAANIKLAHAKPLPAHKRRMLYGLLSFYIMGMFVAAIELGDGFIGIIHEPVIVEFSEIYIEHPVQTWKRYSNMTLSNLTVVPKEPVAVTALNKKLKKEALYADRRRRGVF